MIKDNLIRFENKKKIVEKAETKYEILDKNNNATFIQLNPITGRKHQLRKLQLKNQHQKRKQQQWLQKS